MLANKLYNGSALTTGDSDTLLPKLIRAINHATEIEITVSFIQQSGLKLLFEPLLDALNHKVSIKLLTSDYLSITNPDALRQIMLLQERGAETKIFQCEQGVSFHMKSYIFVKTAKDKIIQACAYVGSNNISRTALTNGHEWCLRHDYEQPESSKAAQEFFNIRSEFSKIFNHSSSIKLDNDWIDDYQKRYLATNKQENFIGGNVVPIDDVEDKVVPNSVQIPALQALEDSRKDGFQRGLVVLATGMGKTWLAAFDVKQMQAKKVLFVAHREEILLQAERTFVQLLPDVKTGLYNGDTKDNRADCIFASILTIGQAKHLEQFAVDYFDYIIVDEFHHASSNSYKKLLAYFQPKFLLGLTATPERTDQADILSLCDHNLIFERNLVHGIDEKILVPFHYYGIYDEFVDYDEIPWRNGRFDPTKLDTAFATKKRANHIFENWKKNKQSRTLAFCVSKKHADYMADFFSKNDVKSTAVYSGSETRRNEALNLLEQGEIDIIFSVDLFNEGTDLPSIDTILMIRPTESKILFLQQLGRGLRQSLQTQKEKLSVIDFIGNHNAFLNKPVTLLNGTGVKDIIAKINSGYTITDGCYINYEPELVNFWEKLAKKYRSTAAEDYQELKVSLGHRPTASEFFLHGYDFSKMRKQHGSWFSLVAKLEEDKELEAILKKFSDFLSDAIETTSMIKSFKAILLESFLELDGFILPPTTQQIAEHSRLVLNRRPDIKRNDLSEQVSKYSSDSESWHKYWLGNPIKAYTEKNKTQEKSWFTVDDNKFQANFSIHEQDKALLHELIQELVDYKLTQYSQRIAKKLADKVKNTKIELNTGNSDQPAVNTENNTLPFKLLDSVNNKEKYTTAIPFYPLEIAAGSFSDSEIDDDIKQWVDIDKLALRKSIDKDMFISQVHGHSMEPLILDGSYCLFKYGVAGSRNGRVVLVKKSGYEDPDTQASFTIKRYFSKKTAQSEYEWGHEKIELRPDNKDYPVLTIEPDEADDFVVIAEFLQVVG
ncbi:MAG: DEAD/DEAH box helicase family protein [Gammaproteobacteria bacterium]|nr:DEAD/DEAH box helicase family protein [Gammaproteobacteria bacterium]